MVRTALPVICVLGVTAPVSAAPASASALALAPAHSRPSAAHARPSASLVADIAPGAAGSDPQDLTVMNGELFFSASDPVHGRQLWESDGTAAGTVMLTDVPGGADPAGLAVADGVLFFSARDAQHGRELWKSDGTAGGTTLVADIVPGPAGSDPRDITYAIGQQGNSTPAQVLVYFSAWDPAAGRQLWRSDGTAAGTAMVSDVNPGPAGLGPADITALTGTTAMFSGDDGVHGREPWVTSGTAAGTAMFEDLNPGSASSDPTEITASAWNLLGEVQLPLWYFSANDGTHGRELFVAYPDSPPADVYDINPGAASSNPGPFVSVAQVTGLVAATGTTGRELYDLQTPPPPPRLEGQQPGTATLVPGVSPGAGSDPVLGPTGLIGTTPFPLPYTRNYFSGDDAALGRQLWQVDESVTLTPGEGGYYYYDVSGVRLVDDGSSGPAGFVNVGGSYDVDGGQSGTTEVFSASDAAHGRELWTSDGWSTNTTLAADVNPGSGSSDPADITVTGQTAYFTADSPASGRELWKLTVPPTPQVYLTGPLYPVTTGSSVTVTASLAAVPNEPEPAGDVTFYSDGTQIANVPVTPAAGGGMQASATFPAASGDHNIVAVYQGDATYTPATTNTATVTGD
ncbi:MAG TPA: ELWxxDGT repeat protein [Streptosporangiaceae bacterium]|nr:ELWxxDGT repeat protein [Streptosporangiaceae bacterium]